jgi:hypothetical protein
MWKRIVLVTEVFQQHHESTLSRRLIPESAETHSQRSAVRDHSRQFPMRVAKRIFSERQLSAVEAYYHLLGYHTDFTSFIHVAN